MPATAGATLPSRATRALVSLETVPIATSAAWATAGLITAAIARAAPIIRATDTLPEQASHKHGRDSFHDDRAARRRLSLTWITIVRRVGKYLVTTVGRKTAPIGRAPASILR